MKHAATGVLRRGVGPCSDTRIKKLIDRKSGVHANSNTACPVILRHKGGSLLPGFVNQMIASTFDLKSEKLLQNDRGEARLTRARQISMYLMNTSLSMNFVEIAAFYRKDRTTVSHACSVVEGLRDAPDFDDRLLELEKTIEMVIQLAQYSLEAESHVESE